MSAKIYKNEHFVKNDKGGLILWINPLFPVYNNGGMKLKKPE